MPFFLGFEANSATRGNSHRGGLREFCQDLVRGFRKDDAILTCPEPTV